MTDVPLQDYIDGKTASIDQSIKDLRTYLKDHFDMNNRALELAREELDLKIKKIDSDYKDVNDRVICLETSKAVSTGQLRLLTLLPSGIAAILALIALFKG
jgi:hypothetical protein